jgi:beta-galactosidase
MGQAHDSIDDKETTSWTSEGSSEKFWIQCDLPKSAAVNQAVLKLAGSRTKPYALAISVDGKIVFSGTTGKNLGYATLDFKPTRGKSVRIATIGKGALSIVVVENYAPLEG